MNTFIRFALVLIMLALVSQSAVAAAPQESLPEAEREAEGKAEEQPLLAASFGLPLPGVGGLQGGEQQSSCSATAYCGANPSVFCSGNSSCSSVDRSCPGVGGAVTCDGVLTACSTNQSCAQGCAADWTACVAECPPGILNPCRIACSEERAACHCNC